MSQPFRLASGGLIDRTQPLRFRFDGRAYEGYAGDTLASALLANGARLIGRSFKYHRPRGVLTAGPEEPNAMVHLRTGARREPNTRATMVELYDGLEATSQNCWPSPRFDALAVNALLSPFFPAGFYYKTFMWPAGFWKRVYEPIIRRAAGLGAAATEPDPDRYEKAHVHVDVLVVGGGPAGLAAAQAAARTGARVMLCEERAEFGGALRRERLIIGNAPALDWVNATVEELADAENVRLLRRTTVFGCYDHNMLAAVERVCDHLVEPAPFQPRQRLWTVRAKQIVLATGAIERPLLFADNDRPGVMLASAARAYVTEYGVAPGRRALIAANNDDAYRTALDLHDAGIEVAAVADLRAEPDGALPRAVRKAGIEVIAGYAVTRAVGRLGVEAAELAPVNGAGGTIRANLDCDLICVSGGWSPTVHLHSHIGERPRWDDARAAFLPSDGDEERCSAGAVTGAVALGDCLAGGIEAGARAASAAGIKKRTSIQAPACPPETEQPIVAEWDVAKVAAKRGKAFVDFQNDVTAGDIALAAREGFVSVEHLKRYTTLGMGTDQGKTSNVNGLALLAERRGEPIPDVGTTTFRPPYTPIALGALGGREIGAHLQPVRRTPLHDWHEGHGAVWVDAGLWRRPRYYPQSGETLAQAYVREAQHVRAHVGLVDVSTLGKIDVQGPDAAEFLNRVYANGWKTLPVGRARYGVMLREDGLALDDGTTARIGEHHFLMTTTTAEAAKVMAHLEFHLDAVWPELRVHLTSVTEQWAQMALAGPKSRDVLSAAVDGADVSDGALPFMGLIETTIAGHPVRIFRISFSGELAYEIATPADYGIAVWEALMAAGEPNQIIPYGTEAMGALRIEKGHVTAAEVNGQTTAEDLGMTRMLSTKKDYVGRWTQDRAGLTDPARQTLVGLVSEDGVSAIRIGSQLIAEPMVTSRPERRVPMLGHVTSTTYSPALGKTIALALLSGGLQHEGALLYAAYPLRNEQTAVRVVSPHFFDPDGERLRG